MHGRKILPETFNEAFQSSTEAEQFQRTLAENILLLAMISIENKSETDSKGIYNCIVYNKNQNIIQNHLEDVFEKYSILPVLDITKNHIDNLVLINSINIQRFGAKTGNHISLD